MVQDSHKANFYKVRSWLSIMKANFKTCYRELSKAVNGEAENLHVYGKFVATLDQWGQPILSNSSVPKDKAGKTGLPLATPKS